MAPDTEETEIIEVETESADADSTLGSDIASELQSLNSLVLQFEYENGRRYHSYQSGQYAFPNDEEELDRMDFEHHIFKHLVGGELHLAPIGTNPQRILDLGTGTGIWAIEMADMFPSASVVGTDLSPVQPTVVPPNMEFQIDDFEQEWTFRNESFDMIHSRLLLASVSNYPKLLQKAFRALKPGGYMEMHDIEPVFNSDDNSIPNESKARLWADLFFEACQKIGHPILLAPQYKTMLEEAGFVDVKLKVYKRPSNSWPKDKRMKHIGLCTLKNHLDGIHAFSIGPFTRILGWSVAEVEILLAECRAEWRDKSIHAYQNVIFAHGRKPNS